MSSTLVNVRIILLVMVKSNILIYYLVNVRSIRPKTSPAQTNLVASPFWMLDYPRIVHDWERFPTKLVGFRGWEGEEDGREGEVGGGRGGIGLWRGVTIEKS
jgi:hypothetical protein